MNIYYASSRQSGEFLRSVLKEEYAIEEPRIVTNEHGKPYLENAPLYFSLSDSGGYVALAVGGEELGLDLQLRVPRNLPALSRRLTARERGEDFFTLWTAKEAYVKYKGGTLARMLSTLEYANGVLYESGKPVSESLLCAELEGCAVALVTATPVEPVFIRK